MALGTNDVIIEGQKTEEEITREQRETYLAALVREKAGLEQRVAQLTHEDAPKNITEDDVKQAKADLQSVKDELARVTGGHGGEPRAKQRK